MKVLLKSCCKIKYIYLLQHAMLILSTFHFVITNVLHFVKYLLKGRKQKYMSNIVDVLDRVYSHHYCPLPYDYNTYKFFL